MTGEQPAYEITPLHVAFFINVPDRVLTWNEPPFRRF